MFNSVITEAILIILASCIITSIKSIQEEESPSWMNMPLPELTKSQISDISSFIEHLLECRGVPGLSLAVVNKERTLLVRGYGFADVQTKEMVTASTRFPIASTSKSFTTTLLAIVLNEQPDPENG